MGRSSKRGKRDKKHSVRKGNQHGDRRENKHEDYPVTKKTNSQYEAYYKEQGIVKEEEWETFLDVLRQPLPTTFRITGFRGEAQEMLKIIKDEYISKLVSNDDCPVHSLPWYPNDLGWQIDLSRREIRQQGDLQGLKDFLLNETESGNISRQEAVSMIPPLVLDVQPHHKVLDMCAAPGSKTAQLIELLHSQGDNVPEGYVIANDVDNKRCYLMVHQVKRLQSPCCAIVNHDATTLPNIRIGDGIKDFVQYDRVLCDVPCSGDGTLRKNIDIWNKWNPNIGPNLHKIQMKILKRGLELLSVGGRLVYSTCSLNPVENEAVVASIMNKCEGCVELVDVSSHLPKLKYSKGLSSWKVFNKKMERMNSLSEAKEKGYMHLEASIFPPDNTQDLHLDRCIRVLPHYQNTGGFFIVALHKTKTLPWMRPVGGHNNEQSKRVKTGEPVGETPTGILECKSDENQGAQQELQAVNQETKVVTAGKGEGDNPEQQTGNQEAETVTSGKGGDNPEQQTENQETKPVTSGKRQGDEPLEPPPTKHKKMHGYKEDPFLFLKTNDPFWDPIQKFYGIRSDFPVEQVMYRAQTGQKRTIYFVSSELRNIVQKNTDRIRFINLGVRIFGRSTSPLVPDCDFRISQEGLSVLGTECITRSVQLSREDMITFISYDNPFFDKLSDQAIGEMKKFAIGCILMTYKPEKGETKPSCSITVCGWRGKSSVRSFLSKNIRAHYLRLFGLELSEIVKMLASNKETEKSESMDDNTETSDAAEKTGDEISEHNETENITKETEESDNLNIEENDGSEMETNENT